jgi:hypothetical protein
VVVALVIALGFNNIWYAVTDWHLRDMNAYWDAAMRLGEGQELYPPVADLTASEVYRYSPWFAWLWVPLTWLPRGVVNVLWSALLVGVSFAAMVPLARRGAWLLVAFFLPILIGISAIGNAHALLIGGLVLGVERRTGPLWIALAASLKFFPVLFVLTYLGRRQWRLAAATIMLTAIFLSPFLVYDLSNYVTDPGEAASLFEWTWLYSIVVAGACAAALWLSRTEFGWLASATGVVLAIPRSFVFDVTYHAVGTPRAADQTLGDGRPVLGVASDRSS